MTVNKVYKYRIYCETEEDHIKGWSENPDEICPNNNSHTVTSGSLTIIDSLTSSVVQTRIQEEVIETGGHFQCISINVASTASGTAQTDISWPFPVSILSAEVLISSDNLGDNIEALVGPNTIIGVLSSPVTSGTTVLPVSSTVLDNISVGYFVTVDSQNLGRVLEIDQDAETITVENETTASISAGEYILQTIKFISSFELVTEGRITLGDTKIGASYIPANTTIRCKYTNNGPIDKDFAVMIEYLY